MIFTVKDNFIVQEEQLIAYEAEYFADASIRSLPIIKNLLNIFDAVVRV